MGKKRNRLNRLPPFVPLIWSMLNHVAYKSLKPSAAKALPYFLGKVKTPYWDPQRYLERFHFSYTEAMGYGFSRGTFSRVIQELVRKGFIDPAERGGLKSFGLGYNWFCLSQRWQRYGTLGFERKEWGQVFPSFEKRAGLRSKMRPG